MHLFYTSLHCLHLQLDGIIEIVYQDIQSIDLQLCWQKMKEQMGMYQIKS